MKLEWKINEKKVFFQKKNSKIIIKIVHKQLCFEKSCSLFIQMMNPIRKYFLITNPLEICQTLWHRQVHFFLGYSQNIEATREGLGNVINENIIDA